MTDRLFVNGRRASTVSTPTEQPPPRRVRSTRIPYRASAVLLPFLGRMCGGVPCASDSKGCLVIFVRHGTFYRLISVFLLCTIVPMDATKVSQVKAVVPTSLKRELFAHLQMRGESFLSWLVAHMQADILAMRDSPSGTTVKNPDSEFLYQLDKESVAAARRRKSSSV